jgi:hypothetical protein
VSARVAFSHIGVHRGCFAAARLNRDRYGHRCRGRLDRKRGACCYPKRSRGRLSALFGREKAIGTQP